MFFIQFVLGNLKEMHTQMKCRAFQSDFVILVWFALITMLALALLRKEVEEIKEKFHSRYQYLRHVY